MQSKPNINFCPVYERMINMDEFDERNNGTNENKTEIPAENPGDGENRENGYYYENYAKNEKINEDETGTFIPPEGSEYSSGRREYPYSSPRETESTTQTGERPSYREPYPYASGENRYPGNEYRRPDPDNGYRAPQQNSGPYPYANNRDGYAYNKNTDNNGGKKSSGGKIFGIIAGCLCVILLVALVFAVASGRKNTPSLPDNKEEETTVNTSVDEIVTSVSPETNSGVNSKGELSPKEIYKKVSGASVGILVYGKSESLSGEGTGVLFKEDNDGKYTYIITCAHVIDDVSGGIVVQLNDGTEYTAEKVGFDNRTDIGILRIEASGLSLAEIGDSSKLAVGDTVYAIGNPGGVEFANSFTNGMISALDRPVSSSSTGYTMECIQHTAAINPGNSGGALVNVFGQVIGINSMKIVDAEYEGMGFSVPSSVFTNIVNEIILHGYVSNRPKLGITYVPASDYNSYGMFVAIKGLPSGCIVIYDINEDSSLAGTEAAVGDMIVAVNGKDMDDASVLSELIENSNVGDTLTLSLIRINKDYTFKEFDVKATLVEDRGDSTLIEEEETTTNPFDSYGDYFNDYFSDYFDDFFKNYGRP